MIHRACKLTTAVVLLSCLLAPPAFSEASNKQWHYLVVEIDDSGVPAAVFYRRVTLRAPRASVSEETMAQTKASLTHRRDWLEIELYSDGKIAFRDLVAVERFVRAEFPNAAGALERTDVKPGRRAAVIRVPCIEGATLVIRATAELSLELDHIDELAAGYRLAGSVPETKIAGQRGGGDPANRMDVLIMGDGYTAAQQAVFTSDANNLDSTFFSVTPYDEYSNYVNTTSLFLASAQSGADHPPFSGVCKGDDPSCCSDSTASGDPLAGSFVSTAFDARFCAFMIHRLLVVDSAKVLAAAASEPDWDKIFVIVNDATYGGSGGDIPVSSTNASSPDVIRHEYGHSFTDLADEYESAFPGFPTCSDIGGPACEANVTDQTVRASVKWEPWIAPGTPVPTPEGSGFLADLGLFEGARYFTTVMHRPREETCAMRGLGLPFCSVCSQAYVLKLYDGGWGVPAGGVDMIEPGSESPSPGPVNVGGSQVFSVTVLAPDGAPAPAIEWRVDGALQSGQTSSSFAFLPPGNGSFTVTVTVNDTTALVHPAMAGSSLTFTRQWTANVTGLIFADGFESGSTSVWSP